MHYRLWGREHGVYLFFALRELLQPLKTEELNGWFHSSLVEEMQRARGQVSLSICDNKLEQLYQSGCA